ncbi:MAG: tRNA preQ1(34) S-adenosylmethionine ribosyltransferase-isomerase QueA [Spirochaetales bacterium]|nr:tRNA preQ1(34) S-adenosylmethionine ribosyltransferase-isomerase QueA [Spirochaetales bacterium]
MKTRDFSFELPDSQIAQEPPEVRGTSRLLYLNRKNEKIAHLSMKDFPGLLPANSVLVVNNSKVRPARLYGTNKKTGGKVEFLFLEQEGEALWRVITSKSKKQIPGNVYELPGLLEAEIVAALGKERIIRLDRAVNESWFEKHGHMPLPPYIKRPDQDSDFERYQTVFAETIGSAAAPTAGLHLTDDILGEIKGRGIDVVKVTLHVGIGTFMPIRSESINDHSMHSENYAISEKTASRLNQAIGEQQPIVAVGTTSVRTLESAWTPQGFPAGQGSTSLYIKPGYKFKAVKHMFTNFHTPESSLLVMVSAFGGYELMMKTYATAVKEGYRFFSYGDAMFIE